jgi:release factor glutamine methyltransferase
VVRVAEALAEGAGRLPRHAGLPEPVREAAWLLAAAWGVGETWLRVHPEAELPPAVADRYRRWLVRRAAGEPAHHLTGTCPFLGRDFVVSPEVLVPRPETELLVQLALELPLPPFARVLDVGTGSGCIGVTLAAERPSWRVVAADRSLAALEVARRNARAHGVTPALAAVDLATAVAPPLDLVVANLPYVPTGDLVRLAPEVRRDPALALDGGPDGLVLVRRLLADAGRLLRPCGGLLLELGEDQAAVVARDAGALGLAVARTLRDVGGCERVLLLQLR